MKVLVILAVVVGAAFAQVQPTCQGPKEFESVLVEINPNRKTERLARLSYDTQFQRIRIKEEVREGTGQEEFYDELFLHEQQIGYRLNLKTKKCDKFSLKEPFPFIGVPSDAHFDGEGYIGTSGVVGAGVLVDLYTADTQRGRYAGTWTQIDCFPVSDTYISRRTGIVHWSFFDVTLGISDPNVFIPPPECQ